MTIAAIIQKGAVGLVSAALLSFGGIVLSERTEQAVQSTQLEALTKHQTETDQTLAHVNESLQTLDKNTAVIIEHMKDTEHGKR